MCVTERSVFSLELALMDDYMEKSTAFEKSLNSEYKKDNGIFYTDTDLATKIIDFLKIETTLPFLIKHYNE